MPKSRSKTGAPRGPDSFLVVHPFMWRALNLKGVELLVFARAYGFCKNGGTFYESRAGTASPSARSRGRSAPWLREGSSLTSIPMRPSMA